MTGFGGKQFTLTCIRSQLVLEFSLFGRNSYGGAINVLSKKPKQELEMGVAGEKI